MRWNVLDASIDGGIHEKFAVPFLVVVAFEGFCEVDLSFGEMRVGLHMKI